MRSLSILLASVLLLAGHPALADTAIRPDVIPVVPAAEYDRPWLAQAEPQMSPEVPSEDRYALFAELEAIRAEREIVNLDVERAKVATIAGGFTASLGGAVAAGAGLGCLISLMTWNGCNGDTFETIAIAGGAVGGAGLLTVAGGGLAGMDYLKRRRELDGQIIELEKQLMVDPENSVSLGIGPGGLPGITFRVAF